MQNAAAYFLLQLPFFTRDKSDSVPIYNISFFTNKSYNYNAAQIQIILTDQKR